METLDFNLPDIRRMRLRDISERYGDVGLEQRFAHEVMQCNSENNWSDEEVESVNSALDDCKRIFGDEYGYTHSLRGAIRIISSDHFGVHDRPDLVIGALLHDTVEDHPRRWLSDTAYAEKNDSTEEIPALTSQQNILVLHDIAYLQISERYGTRIAGITKWVTSAPYHEKITSVDDPVDYQLAKWQSYETGVRELMRSEDALGAKVIKLSDYIENFVGGIKHHENPRTRVKLARKYLPLADDMITFTKQSQIIPDSSKDHLIEQIASAAKIAREMLDDHIDSHPEDARLYRLPPNSSGHNPLGELALSAS